jgi:hypothetical protein
MPGPEGTPHGSRRVSASRVRAGVFFFLLGFSTDCGESILDECFFPAQWTFPCGDTWGTWGALSPGRLENRPDDRLVQLE